MQLITINSLFIFTADNPQLLHNKLHAGQHRLACRPEQQGLARANAATNGAKQSRQPQPSRDSVPCSVYSLTQMLHKMELHSYGNPRGICSICAGFLDVCFHPHGNSAMLASIRTGFVGFLYPIPAEVSQWMRKGWNQVYDSYWLVTLSLTLSLVFCCFQQVSDTLSHLLSCLHLDLSKIKSFIRP